MLLADRVLRLVDASNEHGDPNDDSEKQEEDATDELQGPEDGACLGPCSDNKCLALPLSLSSKSLSAHKCTFLSLEGFKLSLILVGQSPTSASITAFQLALSFSVLL